MPSTTSATASRAATAFRRTTRRRSSGTEGPPSSCIPMAQANLGVMYERGHGTRQDFVQAQMWFMLSASYFRASEAKSRGLVIRNRDQLAAKMTPGTDRGGTQARTRVAAIRVTTPTESDPRGDRGRLSRRVAARLRHARSAAGRLRSRRRSAARRFSRGARAMAARRRAGKSPGVARLGRPLQGHRRHPPAMPVSMRSTMSPRKSKPSPTMRRRRGRPRSSKTIDCGSSSPAAILRSSPEAQVALTLREVCGLATEEIAQAFLLPAPTLAQRIVRAKAKIRDARIPYQVPAPDELPERLASALRVIYLVFNEGYSPSSGAVADKGRPLRRGDPARAAARGSAARTRGAGTAGD